jgi:hypothetical protein
MKQITSLKLKLLAAIITVIISLALGAYTKVMLVLHFADPFERWLNLILYIISWVMLFVAAFFVGKEALILADQWVKKKLQETYDVTATIPKKGIAHGMKGAKELQKVTKKVHKETMKHGKKHLKKGVMITKDIHKKTMRHGKKIHKETIKQSKKHLKQGVKAVKDVHKKLRE